MFAPVVVFTYNRLEHTKNVLMALRNCKNFNDTDVFIFSDAPKKIENRLEVENVRTFLRKFTFENNNVRVIEQVENKGCNKSIKDGITEIINIYGKIIVIEDDIIVNKYFLVYMNSALNRYVNDDDIFSITGYNPVRLNLEKDTFSFDRFSCWGWGTWKNRWDYVDWDKKYIKNIDVAKFKRYAPDLLNCLLEDIKQYNYYPVTWDILVCYTVFEKKKRVIYPKKSMSDNIGLDGSGERCLKANEYANDNLYDGEYSENSFIFSKDTLAENNIVRFAKEYSGFNMKRKIISMIRRITSILHCPNMAKKLREIYKK